MKLFFDKEFTGLHKNTTIISLGIVSEDNRKFYAEFIDYDKTQVDNWIQTNVINNLILNDLENNSTLSKDNTLFCKGDFKNVKTQLNIWLQQFKNKEIQFVSDVCHYDFVLLIDLISGNALDLPDNICAYCHDINQDITQYLNISDNGAFNINRESFVNVKDDTKKHNSLWDAEVIKMCYDKIHNK